MIRIIITDIYKFFVERLDFKNEILLSKFIQPAVSPRVLYYMTVNHSPVNERF